MAVERAKRAMAEAEEKLRTVKHWATDFEHRSQFLVTDLEHVRSLMANEMPKAVAHLVQIMRRLDEYVRVGMTGPASVSDLKVDAPETWPGEDAPNPDSK